MTENLIYYVEVPELEGVWATGKNLEECHRKLEEVIDEWITFRLRNGFHLPGFRKFLNYI